MDSDTLPVIAWGTRPMLVSGVWRGVGRAQGDLLGCVMLTRALVLDRRVLAAGQMIALRWGDSLSNRPLVRTAGLTLTSDRPSSPATE